MSPDAGGPDPGPGAVPGFPPRGACGYAACYCEENVARLLASPGFRGLPARAVLVSNPARSVAVFRQRSGHGSGSLVLWDYHVIALVGRPGSGWAAFDLDSQLDFPVPAGAWLDASCPPDVPPRHLALFRVVEAGTYLAELSSDRSHMRDRGGLWLMPPPPWEAYGAGRPNNLMEWIDMGRPGPGRVMDRQAFAAFLAAGAGT